MKGVGKMVDFLVRKECLVDLVFDDGWWPVEGPILVGDGIFETVLIKKFLDKLDGIVLKLVEIADLVMLGKIANFRKSIDFFILTVMFLIFLLFSLLNLFFDDIDIIKFIEILPRPRLKS